MAYLSRIYLYCTAIWMNKNHTHQRRRRLRFRIVKFEIWTLSIISPLLWCRSIIIRIWRKTASFIFHLEQEVFSTQEEKERRRRRKKIDKFWKETSLTTLKKEIKHANAKKKIATFSWKTFSWLLLLVLRFYQKVEDLSKDITPTLPTRRNGCHWRRDARSLSQLV